MTMRRVKINKVSTTRGTPSTSTDLKEALCEKIPLHHDLLRKLRLQHGSTVVSHITVDDLYQGLNGVKSVVRETSEIDPKSGVKYRGLTIPEVVALLPRRGNAPCPEAVFWLLLTGDIPTHEQTASLTADWTSRRQKCKKWSVKGGGAIGAVLQTLPKNVPPLAKLCIALTALDADKHMQEAIKSGALSHTHWEYAFEDSMELLAALPAIVGLVSMKQESKTVVEEGDWVDFLLQCLGNIAQEEEGKKTSLGEFLRLYITVNADEDGGNPGAHTTQISGDALLDPSHALAAGALAFSNEPRTGTMLQYMDFQTKLQSVLGREPNENALKDFLRLLIEKDHRVPGYGESEFCDPRYNALRDYGREHLPEDPQFKLSQEISKVLTPMLKEARKKNTWPEPSTVAAPILQFYGLRNMEFNQVLLCMSRALGAIASIIWARAMDAPAERPRSSSTYTYLDSIQDVRKKSKKNSIKYIKRFPK